MTLRSMQFALILFGFLSAFAAHGADTVQPVQIMPGDIKWTAVPSIPGFELTWLHGGADKPGLYEVRVRMTQGALSCRVPIRIPDTSPSCPANFMWGSTARSSRTRQKNFRQAASWSCRAEPRIT